LSLLILQKENRHADELILLAIQQLLCKDAPTDSDLFAAASILDAGMGFSPHNAHLKISAMFVYSRLHAAGRSWELFQSLYIKHIQHESCAYLIVPILRSGGLYEETIAVCKEVLRLQRANVQDASTFSQTAMDNGALTKANEFLNFQWNRMSKSITTLEAKGLILDAAPLFGCDEKQQGVLGALHGIVGGETDFERANEMIAEAQDPFGVFSLLSLRGDAKEIAGNMSENRDFSVLSHDILVHREFETPEQIVRDSLRRGHLHRLLIRSALCVEVTKGPKKGKVIHAGGVLTKRCSSLLLSIDSANEDCGGSPSPPGYSQLLQVALSECRVLVAISSGLLSGGKSLEKDTLESREDAATQLLGDVRDGLVSAKSELGSLGAASIHQISRMLPECIVPAFALFRMCAHVLDLYGWGRRKRKTKRCAGALADVSLAFASLVDKMMGPVAA